MKKTKVISAQLLLLIVMACFLSASVMAGEPWNEDPGKNTDSIPFHHREIGV